MIQKMLPEDYQEVYKLGKLLHPDYKEKYNFSEEAISPFFHCYVYKEKNKVIGFLAYTKVTDNVDIVDIVVDPEHRRKKVATCLLDYLITNIDPEDKIFLEVRVSNESAIELYKKMGFNIISTRKNYYQNEDAYVMERVKKDE